MKVDLFADVLFGDKDDDRAATDVDPVLLAEVWFATDFVAVGGRGAPVSMATCHWRPGEGLGNSKSSESQ